MIAVEEERVSSLQSPGRSCPLHYRYRPEDFAVEAPYDQQDLEVLYVVGGIYGNELALARVLELFEAERGRKRLVFNGDFHWVDADPASFSRVQSEVLAHGATRGNVETELATADEGGDTGCGCAYPDWVGDGVVERSNRILGRLRLATNASQRAEMSVLPMWLRADVGTLRLAIVHGDATSLAGWGFAQEHLRDAGHRAEVARWLDRAEVDACACTHTCLPVFQAVQAPSGRLPRWILNNGAAGMPNFRGDTAGLLTRIAVEPFAGSEMRFGVATGRGVMAEAIAIDIDAHAWRAGFEAQWPAGSDAYQSYFDRIVQGPAYDPADAVRQLE
ncbi:MAG: hypothetical protein ACK5ZQ_18140 [bacterium]